MKHILAAFSLLATTSAAQACFSNLNIAGQINSGNSFTDGNFLEQWALTPLLSQVDLCVNRQGAINGFQATVALVNPQNRFVREEQLTAVGTTTDCTGVSIDYANGEQLLKMTLAWNQKSIKGVRVETSAGNEVEVGVFRNMPSTETLDFGDKIVGFYGTQESQFVYSLGGIQYTCATTTEEETEPGPVTPQPVVAQAKESSSGSGGTVVLVLFLLSMAGAALGFTLRYREWIKAKFTKSDQKNGPNPLNDLNKLIAYLKSTKTTTTTKP